MVEKILDFCENACVCMFFLGVASVPMIVCGFFGLLSVGVALICAGIGIIMAVGLYRMISS